VLKRIGDSAVQAEPLWREQVGVDDLTEQWVPEPVRVAADDHQLRVGHGPQGDVDLVFGQRDDGGEKLMARLATHRRDRPQDVSSTVVETGDLGRDQIRQDYRSCVAGQVGGDELPGEKKTGFPGLG